MMRVFSNPSYLFGRISPAARVWTKSMRTKMRSVPAVVIGAFLLVVLPIAPGLAESDIAKTLQDRLTARIEKLETACGRDVKKYCRTVTPGEGRILYCLQAYEDKISSKCDYELEDIISSTQSLFDNLKEAVLACRTEISETCGKVQPGKGRIAACLLQNKSTVSKACSDAIEKLQSQMEKSDMN